MLFQTIEGRVVNTERELDEAQNHVLMKLMAWEKLGLAVDEFERRRREALRVGWNGRGGVSESEVLRAVADDLARRLALRQGTGAPARWLKAQLWPGAYSGGGLRPEGQANGSLELLVLDAADQLRGMVSLSLATGQPMADALHAALGELGQGRGPLAEPIARLGLSPRP